MTVFQSEKWFEIGKVYLASLNALSAKNAFAQDFILIHYCVSTVSQASNHNSGRILYFTYKQTTCRSVCMMDVSGGGIIYAIYSLRQTVRVAGFNLLVYAWCL